MPSNTQLQQEVNYITCFQRMLHPYIKTEINLKPTRPMGAEIVVKTFKTVENRGAQQNRKLMSDKNQIAYDI